MKVLGIIINGEEKVALNEKNKEISNETKPECLKDLRSFLDSAGWFRSFIKNSAGKTRCFKEGLKKKNKWICTGKMDQKFEC